MNQSRIFLLYPYYWPNFRAGGPSQSLFNLVGQLRDKSNFYIVSLNNDIDGSPTNPEVQLNVWQHGPNGENVFYASSLSFFLLQRLIKEVKPDVLFVNGLFNASTTIPGIILAKYWKIKLVISPRGMLQPWALQQRKIIKMIFIRVIKVFLKRTETWHATDELERTDILKNFGNNQRVHVAPNIPRRLSSLKPIEFPDKNKKIKLVFLSLINPNKNLHLVIDAVTELSQQFSLDIYGPIADAHYWESCKSRMVEDATITYRGGVPPWDVPTVLQQYHFFVLPTVGENFGHAIFDSLSCGVPVLISRTTPWQDIEEKNAGYYIDSLDSGSLVSLLKRILEMNEQNYTALRMNSYEYATNYWKDSTFDKDYTFLTLPEIIF